MNIKVAAFTLSEKSSNTPIFEKSQEFVFGGGESDEVGVSFNR